MSEEIKSDLMSRRRALSLLGLGAALSLSASTLLSASEADGSQCRRNRRATPPLKPIDTWSMSNLTRSALVGFAS